MIFLHVKLFKNSNFKEIRRKVFIYLFIKKDQYQQMVISKIEDFHGLQFLIVS